MAPKTIKLNQYEHIIAVVPEPATGPGWSNTPVWVYIEDSRGKKLRTECIQTEEQTEAMRTLYGPGSVMHAHLTRAVPVKFVKVRAQEEET